MSKSMRQADQNRDVVRRAVDEVFNDADYDAIDELYAEDFVQHGGPGGAMSDRDSFRDFVRGLHAAFPDSEAEEEFCLCEGDFVGIPATGERVEGIVINRVEDGRIVETWAVVDTLEMMRQVGMVGESAE